MAIPSVSVRRWLINPGPPDAITMLPALAPAGANIILGAAHRAVHRYLRDLVLRCCYAHPHTLTYRLARSTPSGSVESQNPKELSSVSSLLFFSSWSPLCSVRPQETFNSNNQDLEQAVSVEILVEAHEVLHGSQASRSVKASS